jgi:pimeloyl-ACP methyl ester carboxylesterase
MARPVEQLQPVAFRNRKGLRLFGVLHTPEGSRRSDVAIILLSPGVKMRVGPQCLYRRMTELFVGLGFTVLRFDFFGLGDSEGVLPEENLKEVYGHIEIGRFVDDTVDAMNWMQEQYGTKKFVVSGLCGGAITGLLAANRDPRIAGLLGLGITPLLASRAADPSTYFSAGQLAHLRQGYIKKILDPKSWLRLLSFRSDYRLIWKSILNPLKKKLTKPAPAAPVAPVQDDASPLFPPAFFAMAGSGRPMLLIFGGSDRLRWDFEEKFVARHQARLQDLEGRYDVHVIEHANHVLSFKPWQAEMLAVSQDWLRRHFPSV